MSKKSRLLPVFGAACCAPLSRGPLDVEQAAPLAAIFKALGDPIRLRLMSLIASHVGGEAAARSAGPAAGTGGVCVCDLTGAFDVTGPTISHHLRVLREAGLIECERRGTWVYYWPVPGVLAQLAALLDGQAAS